MIRIVILCCKPAYRQTHLWRHVVNARVVLSSRENDSGRPGCKETSDEWGGKKVGGDYLSKLQVWAV